MKEVTVLLSTYNGEKYLVEQLNSILHQENVEINIFARDDSSTDLTINILNKYNIRYYRGNNIGAKNSFFDLIKKVPLNTEYYAFSDQDDIWLKDKLFIAIQKLEKTINVPSVYFCERKLLIGDAEKNVTCCNESIKFPNVFFKSVAAGCTIVLNKKMMLLLKQYTPLYAAMHDSWIIILASLFGNVIYDKRPHILYRIHDNNVVGLSKSTGDRIKEFIRRILKDDDCTLKRSLLSKDLLKGYYKELNKIDKKNFLLIKLLARDNKNIFCKIRLFFFPRKFSKKIIDDFAIRIQMIRGVI